ncbi:EAL domain-containing protein [Thiomicrospira microaerophila]|uniref:putative bifunctional diguanylate cyclase/phosphodiesterase n=1 Tax=Thiomicrospira microaerophila TaxID=406020 RepID=UPI00200BA23C|nr:EAL domain-containing protein [Thiomicrospira microaerophila]UQB42589.1 EAL domain-containing protein [Thiomicrospira microaerophila]
MMRLKSLIGLGLLLVLALGALSYYWQFKQLEQATYKELQAVNELKTKQLNHWLSERRADAKVLAENTIFIELVEASFKDAAARTRLKNRLGLFLDAKGYGQISLHEFNGDLLINAGDKFKHLPTVTQNQFEGLRFQYQPMFTDIFIDDHGYRHLGMLMPIWSESNVYQPLAVLVFHIDPRDFIDPLMLTWPSLLPSPQSLLVRFDQAGMFAQTPVQVKEGLQYRHTPLEGYQGLRKQKELGLKSSQLGCQNEKGQAIWIYCNSLETPRWSVISQVEKAALLAPLVWQSFLMALVFGMMLLSLGVLVYQRAKVREREVLDSLKVAASVFDNTGEGIMLTNADCKIEMVNNAFCELLGYQASEVLGKTPDILRSGRHDQDFYQSMWHTIQKTGHWRGEIWNRKKNGELIAEWLSIASLNNQQGEVTHYVGVFADISKLKHSEQKLDYLSHHDPLTGLANRRLLNVHIQQALSHHSRRPAMGEHLAVLMLDIDRFKAINDSYGHALGDELLVEVSKVLQHGRRKTDTVARIGADEFTLVLDELQHPEDAARIASQLIRDLASPIKLSNGSELSLGVTVGITLLKDPAISGEQLIQQADTALYQAKIEGRGGFLFFEPHMTRQAQERLIMESQLKQALKQDQFEVFYQPQVDVRSRQIISAEALVRWHHPELGMVSPSYFIPICEEIGLIIELGELVLNKVLVQGAEWLAQGAPRRMLAVNVAALQWQQSDFVDKVERVLKQTGYPAELLELELTESGLMRHEEQAIEAMQRLRKLGVHIAMDDFGTGYSSLIYLRNLPLSKLKIDKQFIDEVVTDLKSQQLAKIIIKMAHNLGFKVIAEGVENSAQLAWLVEQGCDSYQGFLCSPPVRAQDFIKLNSCQGH